MVSVAELLELTLFDDFELVSGKNGLHNDVNTVAILEYESYQKNYDVFSPGDFILTSLFFAKDNPDLITEALLALMQKPVSAIAVKTMFFYELPQPVLDAAERLNIPIFFFHKAYMEDLIISANELLKSKLQYLIFEEKVTALIETSPTAHTVTAAAREINYHFLPYVTAVYLTPKKQSSRNSIANYFNRLNYKRYRSKTFPRQYSYVKYRQGMLLLLSFGESMSFSKETLLDIIEEQLALVDVSPADFFIGIADSLHPLAQLNLAISQALTANRICQLQKSGVLLFSESGIYRLVTPLLFDAAFLEDYQEKIAILLHYDEKYTSNLLQTLADFVSCNGEIAATAAKIYQHPNTVRYRLKKISSLWSIDQENLYNYAFLYMHAYELLTHTNI